jgi:ComF family protein
VRQSRFAGTEAVFSSSSTGFRIRAAQGQAADHPFVGFARRAVATLFFTFFPADCRLCGAPLLNVSRLPVCQDCIKSIYPLKGTYCAVCGEALQPPPQFEDQQTTGETDADGETRCMLCQRTDPPYERAVAHGNYAGELRALIHLLKFQSVRPAAAVLGHMLAETIAPLERVMPVGTIAIVPVPLYHRKRAQRGFNQAETISREALRELKRPKRFELCTGVLLRSRETGSQIGLTRHQRRENLRGAFTVSDPTRIAKRDILLIDDVFTTGTTASECARVLLRAGAARVWVATVARTLKLNTSVLFTMPENIPEDLIEANVEDKEDREQTAAHGRGLR